MLTRINKLKQSLKNKQIIILDGAMGTEISAHGVKTTLPLWSAGCLITSPKVIRQIHIDYINAGAQIITTSTFRTTRRTFEKIGKGNEARKYAILACNLAREAILKTGKKDVLIAGSVAPLEDCYSPELVPFDKELKKEHLEYVKDLKSGGVDFIFAETMISLREIKAVCEASKEVGLPMAVSFCCNKDGNILSGEKLEDAVRLVERYSPGFLSLNCMSLNLITKVFKKLRKITSLPISVYAQGDGKPSNGQGWKFKGNSKPEIYSEYAREWLKDGAQIIGGCCGTNPDYIKKVAAILLSPPDKLPARVCN